jgi:cytochrome P450 family 135
MRYHSPSAFASEHPGLPPGPRMPSALQAVGWALRPLSFMERCQKRFGDIFTLRIRHTGTWVLLCDPDEVGRVFTADPGLLGVGLANTLLGPLLGQRSVMLLEEPEHMRRRKLILPSFHGRLMESYGEMIGEVARREVGRWPVGEPLELWPRMQAITLGVVMRAVFGDVETDFARRLRGLLGELTEWLNAPHRLTLLATLGPRWVTRDPTFQAVMGSVEAAMLEEVRRRRSEGDLQERGDIVSTLARTRYEDGSPMSERDVRDELVTLLSDGPTSTLLAWAFERLLRHPDKLARLRDEARSGEDDVYLDAVVKETMRLCPAAPVVVRRLMEPMRLGGYTLPAGTRVAPCIHLIHRREDVYPEPLSFIPERFLGRSTGAYTWIPFGGGARRCIAASFAQLEMKQVIKTVLEEVELRPAKSGSERARRSSIAFAPNRQALALVSRRTPAMALTPRLA